MCSYLNCTPLGFVCFERLHFFNFVITSSSQRTKENYNRLKPSHEPALNHDPGPWYVMNKAYFQRLRGGR